MRWIRSFVCLILCDRKRYSAVLTIVFGDSHLQAGYNTGKIMRLMQHDFGNAGRGWISPFKIV